MQTLLRYQFFFFLLFALSSSSFLEAQTPLVLDASPVNTDKNSRIVTDMTATVQPIPTFEPVAARPIGKEICDNGIDDDGDGLFDCLDSDCNCSACGGKHANVWYFGIKGGLDFNNVPPTSLIDGKMNTQEGVSSIADANGHLLFYTDGTQIWDRKHNLMPNGTGLKGHSSSCQAAVIVPHPGNKLLYYVFTTGFYENAATTNNGGLCYTVVDMSQNGGYGDVTVKNQVLLGTSTEKVATIKHCNAKYTWIVGHDEKDNFYSYLLDVNGLNKTPVVSKIGTYYWDSRKGFLKGSTDASLLATTIEDESTIEVFDFNNSTGTLSNVRSVYPQLFPWDWKGAYGIEFSPDSKLLYVSITYEQANVSVTGASRLLQFDLSKTTSSTLFNSFVEIKKTDFNFEIGALQLAPDGTIIVANPNSTLNFSPYLGVIYKPNNIGTSCNYVHRAINLGPTSSVFLGLPTFQQIFPVKKKVEIIGSDTICNIPTEKLYKIKLPQSDCGNHTVAWVLSGNATVKTKTDSTVLVRFDVAGKATVICNYTDECQTISDTFNITIPNIPTLSAGADKKICSNGSATFQASSGLSNYVWSDGTKGTKLTTNKAGTYYVSATDICGNIHKDTVIVSVVAQLEGKLDTFACFGEKLLYKGIQIPADSSMKFNLKSVGGCDSTLTVKVLSYDPIKFEPKIQPIRCAGQSNGQIFVSTTQPNLSYSIKKGVYQPDSLFTNLGPDTYNISAQDQHGCTLTKKITLSDPPNLSVNLPKDTIVQEGTVFTIVPTIHGATSPYTYTWSPTQNLTCNDCVNPMVTGVTGSTTYQLTLTDANGCTAKATFVLGSSTLPIPPPECKIFIPNAFSPNGDEGFTVFSADECLTEIRTFSIFDRWGNWIFYKEHFDPNNPDISWNGKYKGEPLDSGVFTYVILLIMKDGKEKIVSGDVFLAK
jgi:gliding motility-associated-like protein